ncbi:DUF2585 family protein [Pseudonocardia sp. TMWB2A]|uniref:DUF2585 family protein n=1 Tax=Pseudonocardia sp. TMWB2A TaxID=687430 RepID=UPI00307DA77D
MTNKIFSQIGRRWWIAVGVALLAFIAVMLAMGRPVICTCGTVKLWHGIVQSAENSQHIADWYTFSHIIHGFIFYGVGWLLLRNRPLGLRLLLAVLVEGGWEILENSPVIIDRYREATISYGYSGDSLLNSLFDIIWMMAGFLFAAWDKVKTWWVVALALAFEAMTLATIRDNLTLNVWMLLAPNESIRNWQGGAPFQ